MAVNTTIPMSLSDGAAGLAKQRVRGVNQSCSEVIGLFRDPPTALTHGRKPRLHVDEMLTELTLQLGVYIVMNTRL